MLAAWLFLPLALLPQAPGRGGARAQARDLAPPRTPESRPLAGRGDPDVLIVLGDDFNWDDVAAVPTPALDALAAAGLTLENGYVFPQCSTTRYSLVFGRYPRRDGIGALVGTQPPGPNNPTPPLGLPTLPGVCQSTPRSFCASALIGKWHLGTHDEYDDNPAPDLGPIDLGAWTPQLHGFGSFLAGTMSNLPASGSGDYFQWDRVDNGVYSRALEYAPAAQLAAFRAYWRRAGRKLAVLAPNLPHAPLQTPPPEWLPPGYPAPRSARQRFEAMLVAFDRMLSEALREVDLTNTYVFVLADNGTQPSISITPCSPLAGLDGCTKTTVWQGGIRVPFLVAGPLIPPGSRSTAPVSSVDLMATVAELLGLDSPGEDSISFAPVLFDPLARPRRIAFSETFGLFDDPFGNPVFRHESAAIGERYKLRRLDASEFLFDLVNDPGERVRLDAGAPALAGIAAELRAVLDDPLRRELQVN